MGVNALCLPHPTLVLTRSHSFSLFLSVLPSLFVCTVEATTFLEGIQEQLAEVGIHKGNCIALVSSCRDEASRVLDAVIGEQVRRAVQYSAVRCRQYGRVHYSTRQCSAVLYSTVQYKAMQYSRVQFNTLRYSTLQYDTVRYSTMQYSTVHYSTVLMPSPPLPLLLPLACSMGSSSTCTASRGAPGGVLAVKAGCSHSPIGEDGRERYIFFGISHIGASRPRSVAYTTAEHSSTL